MESVTSQRWFGRWRGSLVRGRRPGFGHPSLSNLGQVIQVTFLSSGFFIHKMMVVVKMIDLWWASAWGIKICTHHITPAQLSLSPVFRFCPFPDPVQLTNTFAKAQVSMYICAPGLLSRHMKGIAKFYDSSAHGRIFLLHYLWSTLGGAAVQQ